MAVIGLASAVAGFVKVRYLVDKALIDNFVFRAHYRVTSALLFLFCVIVTANNLIGEPISCINDGGVQTHVLNTYCWITYTFTLPDHHGKPIGTHVAHSGVGPVKPGDETTYHAYYQWVPFFLFFQGILFYGPHWIWKNYEEGKIRMLTDGLRGILFTSANNEERKNRQSRLAKYIVESLHTNNTYAAWYFFCELLNVLNVIGNIFFVDKFLGGAFLTYGTDVVKFMGMDQENRTDPMIAIFPRMTKCTFHKFGPSGTIQTHDALCVLALNIINEKIFVFLWFWLIILAVGSAVVFLLDCAITFAPSIRESVIRRKFKPQNNANSIPGLVRKTKLGDFLVIHLISLNLSEPVFNEVMEEVCQLLQLGSNGPQPSSPSSLELSSMYPTVERRTDV